jgi:hypothetical protein
MNIENIFEACKIIDEKPSVDNEENKDGPDINIFKYDMLKLCIDRVLREYDEETEDDDMGLFALSDANVSLKIAFNTLIKYNILIEDEDE